jgi:hypothetical protein
MQTSLGRLHMNSIVRDSISSQTGCSCTQFHLCALAQVGGAISHTLRSQELFVVVLLALAVVAAVTLTAIWSSDKDRRKDACDVLSRFVRWHG